MPFKKVGDNDYTGPSGRHFNQAQVRLYYANGSKFPGQKFNQGGSVMAKSSGMKDACYATGGAVIGKTSEFMKTPDRFRGEQNDPSTFGKGAKGQAKGPAVPKVKLPMGKAKKQ